MRQQYFFPETGFPIKRLAGRKEEQNRVAEAIPGSSVGDFYYIIFRA